MRLPRVRRDSERGSATLELAVIAPGLLALLGLVLLAGRIQAASSAVEQASAAAARTASISRDARAAQASAQQTVRDSLADQGVACRSLSTEVDVTGFGTEVGQPAGVSVRVACALPLSDVAVPGMPGERKITASASSPLDRYRARS